MARRHAPAGSRGTGDILISRRPETTTVFVVETLDEARAVVGEARERNLPIMLVTGPGACARLGPGYLFEMMRQAGAEGEQVRMLIDCGPDPGYAMLALRLGWREIHFKAEPSIVARIADMTQSLGGTFHHQLPGSRDFP